MVPFQNEIATILKQIEQEYKFTILFAAEAGSRALGLESESSDFDVRIIYIHPLDWYLRVDQEEMKREIFYKTFITQNEQQIEVDVSGFELQKCLQQIRKCNPTIFEWFQCEHIYHRVEPWADQIKQICFLFFNRMTVLYHYEHIAKQNFCDFIKFKQQVNRKKYLYILRHCLSGIYLLQHNECFIRTTTQETTPLTIHFPPLHFETLVQEMKSEIPDTIMEFITYLIERKKRQSGQWEPEPPIPALDQFHYDLRIKIKAEADKEREIRLQQLANKVVLPWDHLNQLFCNVVHALHEKK